MMNERKRGFKIAMCGALAIFVCSACSQKAPAINSSAEPFGNTGISTLPVLSSENASEAEGSADEQVRVSELFMDVTESDWFCGDIQFVLENDLMSGTTASTFSPEAEATRGMIVTSLWKLDGCPKEAVASFSDVSEEQDCAAAVAWALGAGVITGYENNTFAPDEPVTREQLATILYRYAEYSNFDVSQQIALDVYSDSDSVSQYAIKAMSWVNAAGIMTGVSATELAPQSYATRSQMAAILKRFCEKYFVDSLADDSKIPLDEEPMENAPTTSQPDANNPETEEMSDGTEREDSSNPTPEPIEPDPARQQPDNIEDIDYGNSPSIVVSNVSNSKRGQDVTVQVSVKNNPGILGMTLTISYDDSVMTLESAENGSALDALSWTKSKELKNGCNFLWDGIEVENEEVQDGVILQLVFHIAEDAAEGKYPISFTASEGGTVDNNLNTIGLTMYSCYVTVQQ